MAWFAIAMAALGAFLPWSSDGPVRLDGTEGPNNGWLVLIVAALALGCVRSMARGSWVGVLGVLGVLGAGLIIGWTASNSWLDNRHVMEATVVAASVALVCAAVTNGVLRLRRD